MKNSKEIKKIMLLGVLGALVACLQMIKIPLGTFSITLALIPIVIGSIIAGPKGGAFLGLIMAIVVLFVDASFFYALNPAGTIITVIVKSVVAGIVCAIVYKAVSKKNNTLGIISASLITPIVNTGIFILGCMTFFYPNIIEMSGGSNALTFTLVTFVGLNFFVELGINIVLIPTLIYIINVVAKNFNLNTIK